jgi:hypothetical protein
LPRRGAVDAVLRRRDRCVPASGLVVLSEVTLACDRAEQENLDAERIKAVDKP